MLLDHTVVCLFLCLFATMPKCLIHKTMVADCFLVVEAISKTTFPDPTRLDQTRPDQTGPDRTLQGCALKKCTLERCSLRRYTLVWSKG